MPQDEAPQRLQRRVHGVDFLLEPLNLPGDDAQGMVLEIGAVRCGEVGAEVEQLVLDGAQAIRQLSGT